MPSTTKTAGCIAALHIPGLTCQERDLVYYKSNLTVAMAGTELLVGLRGYVGVWKASIEETRAETHLLIAD